MLNKKNIRCIRSTIQKHWRTLLKCWACTENERLFVQSCDLTATELIYLLIISGSLLTSSQRTFKNVGNPSPSRISCFESLLPVSFRPNLTISTVWKTNKQSAPVKWVKKYLHFLIYYDMVFKLQWVECEKNGCPVYFVLHRLLLCFWTGLFSHA